MPSHDHFEALGTPFYHILAYVNYITLMSWRGLRRLYINEFNQMEVVSFIDTYFDDCFGNFLHFGK